MCGQKFGRKLIKPLRYEKNRNWQTRSQSLTMLIEREEFTLSVQMTKSTKKPSNMREENWKDPWLQPCRARDNRESRKWLRSRTTHPRRIPKQCIVEKWNSMNPQDKEQNLRGFTSMSHFNLMHKFIPMPQAMKIPDAKAAADK